VGSFWTRTSIDPAAVPNHCRGGRGFEPLVCSEGFNRVNAGRSLPALPLAAGQQTRRHRLRLRGLDLF
jgi:hypothetical protein